MTVTTPEYDLPKPHPDYNLWAGVDAMLLVLILMLSADMLVQVRVFQSPLWMLCYALTTLRLAAVWPKFFPVLLRNWVVLLYPAICVISVLWSRTPSYSLTASFQLTMTMMMGIFLGWRYSLAVLLKVMAVVLSIGVGLSILHWATGIFPWPVYTPIGGLAGLFSSKNMLGLRALFAVIAICALLLMSRRDVGPVFRQLALLALLGNIFAISLSLSITSVLLLPFMTGILMTLCWHRIPPVLVSAGLLGALLALSAGPVMLAIYGINPIDALLGAVGKSSTLTGRVYLWQIALDAYPDQPLLGLGYRAFWQAPEFANERLAAEAAGATTSRSFHNFALEILVSVGLVGLLAIAALIWAGFSRLWRLFYLTRSPVVAGTLSLMVGLVIASLLGTNLYRGHEIMNVLAVAFAVSAGEDLVRLRMRQDGPEQQI
ncbi:MAG: hypothetical protein BM562_04920 [Alphaproteobacteria bacterium MedPE-SWcel]|nr:MAG: hypothetical protein BM562_04920 [Alphaproteobacteria bacterium MedPE-SWcel]